LNISTDANTHCTLDNTSSNPWDYVRTEHHTQNVIVNALLGIEQTPTKK